MLLPVVVVEEKLTVSVPATNTMSVLLSPCSVSSVLPEYNLITRFLNQQLGDGGGGEDHIRLWNSGTQRELGDVRSVLDIINSLQVEDCQLVLVDHCLVPHVGLPEVVVLNAQLDPRLPAVEGRDHFDQKYWNVKNKYK